MEASYQTQDVSYTKIFSTIVKPPMRRLYCYVEPTMYEEIVEVSRHEELEISATVRELLSLALRYYKLKRGTLNPSLAQNNQTFYCQICSQLTSLRKLHSVAIMYDEYKFCEDCFFADKYKNFLTKRINML